MRHIHLGFFLFVGCASPAPSHPPSTAHWGYDAADGPTRWATLDGAFATCATGHEQSPVDLASTALPADAASLLSFHLAPVPLHIIDNGHTLQVNANGELTVQRGNATFALAQFHFHVPSEHTIDGKPYAAELHAVHKSADGRLLVIGLLFTNGAENQTLAPLFATTPDENAALDLSALVSTKPRFFHYAGSLTTPPCTEGVEWYVIDPRTAPATMSESQLAKLTKAGRGDNHRPTQPLGDRHVTITP